jgi:phage shock protein B
MHASLIVAIVFGGSVLALAIIGGTFLMAIKIIKGGVSRKQQQLDAEEAKMIQEIYQSLTRMEERVESLETILIDRAKRNTDHETSS